MPRCRFSCTSPVWRWSLEKQRIAGGPVRAAAFSAKGCAGGQPLADLPDIENPAHDFGPFFTTRFESAVTLGLRGEEPLQLGVGLDALAACQQAARQFKALS